MGLFYLASLLATVTPPGGQAMAPRAGYTMTILRKQDDGRWVVTRDANLLTAAAG